MPAHTPTSTPASPVSQSHSSSRLFPAKKSLWVEIPAHTNKAPLTPPVIHAVLPPGNILKYSHLPKEAKGKRKLPNKFPCTLVEDVYCISLGPGGRARNYGYHIKKTYVSQFGDKEVEVPENFPEAQRVLTRIRTGSCAGCGDRVH